MEETNNGYVMPVAPMGGYGNGFGGDSSWLFVLFLFAMMGGWNNNMGNSNVYPWLNQSNQINDGFRDSMMNTSVNGIQNAVNTGFGDVQTALCGGFAGVNATVNGTQSILAQQMYANQIAELERSFAAQTANAQALNSLQSQFAQCCCDNRLATTQTQTVIQNDGAATRSAIQAGVQSVLDKMCADKIDEKNEKIVELNNKINSLEANNYIQNALTAQTQYFLSQYPRTDTTTG